MKRRRSPKNLGSVEGTIRGLARGGDGVFDSDLGVVFVAGAFPGDRVRARIEEVRPSFRRGRVLEVLEPGKSRRESPCEVSGLCGGCPWMALEPEAQRSAKAEFVADAFSCFKDPPELQWVLGADLAYRRRARLGWRQNRLGYHRRRRSSLVDIQTCPVLQPQLENGLQVIRQHVLPLLAGEGELRLARSGEGAVAYLQTSITQPPAAYEKLAALVPEHFVGISFDVEGSIARFGDPAERMTHLDDQELVGPAAGFSQAHDLNEELAKTVVAAASQGKNILELYAGHGNFTVLLAAATKGVVAVELEEGATEALRQNLRSRGLKARVVAADAADYPKPPVGGYDVVVLDPPRSGAKDVMTRICSEKLPKRIVYVSCDTATLARDLKPLADAGFRPTSLQAFDLFPQTAHVETLVVLDR
ncbi:MAG: 23S rRNA (uracil1939-C5)-methyltransferase [Polyangiales bacterium]|jgi:23S rRNA (uracil1939-C5)-methyltransferase